MIRKNWWKILLSSLVIISPTVLALILRDSVKSGMRGAWYFTWIMPLVLVLFNVTAIVFSLKDNEKNGQSEKIINMMFWILPVLSLYCSGIFFMLALGVDFNIGVLIHLLLGIMFIAIGNYMPKAVRNRTFGIKIKWTMANDANWAATHRFTSKLWVICGIATLLLSFLPFDISMLAFIVVLLAAVVPPAVYSYVFYKRQIASGEATEEDYRSYAGSSQDKKISVAVVIVSFVTLVLVAVLMFAGSIKIGLDEDSLEVNTTFGGGVDLSYSELRDAKIEYRSGKVDGVRVVGYASAKLLFGQFSNDEFGVYTRYTYTDSESSIIIHTDDGVIVIADKTAEATSKLYNELIMKIAASR